MKEDTVVSVLHYLRQVAVRDGLDTLPHVDALLEAHGLDPEKFEVPKKRPKAFKRGEATRPARLSLPSASGSDGADSAAP